jgi:hypothetical protein
LRRQVSAPFFPWLCLLILSRIDTDSFPEVLNQDAGMITVKIKLVERCTHRPNNEVQDLPSMKHGKYSAGQLHIG